MSWLSGLLGGLVSSPSTASNVVTAGADVLASIERIATGKGTLSDGVTIVNVILEGVEIVDPATAPIITLAIDLEPIAATLIESGAVKVDPNPIADVQTSPPQGGWKGR